MDIASLAAQADSLVKALPAGKAVQPAKKPAPAVKPAVNPQQQAAPGQPGAANAATQAAAAAGQLLPEPKAAAGHTQVGKALAAHKRKTLASEVSRHGKYLHKAMEELSKRGQLGLDEFVSVRDHLDGLTDKHIAENGEAFADPGAADEHKNLAKGITDEIWNKHVGSKLGDVKAAVEKMPEKKQKAAAKRGSEDLKKAISLDELERLGREAEDEEAAAAAEGASLLKSEDADPRPAQPTHAPGDPGVTHAPTPPATKQAHASVAHASNQTHSELSAAGYGDVRLSGKDLAKGAMGQILGEAGLLLKSENTSEATMTGPLGKLAAEATDLLKSDGEGSRGGKVIAHSKDGKPIYESSHAVHPSERGNHDGLPEGSRAHMATIAHEHETHKLAQAHMDALREHSQARGTKHVGEAASKMQGTFSALSQHVGDHEKVKKILDEHKAHDDKSINLAHDVHAAREAGWASQPGAEKKLNAAKDAEAKHHLNGGEIARSQQHAAETRHHVETFQHVMNYNKATAEKTKAIKSGKSSVADLQNASAKQKGAFDTLRAHMEAGAREGIQHAGYKTPSEAIDYHEKRKSLADVILDEGKAVLRRLQKGGDGEGESEPDGDEEGGAGDGDGDEKDPGDEALKKDLQRAGMDKATVADVAGDDKDRAKVEEAEKKADAGVEPAFAKSLAQMMARGQMGKQDALRILGGPQLRAEAAIADQQRATRALPALPSMNYRTSPDCDPQSITVMHNPDVAALHAIRLGTGSSIGR